MSSSIRIIVGLGNPGATYAATRHNVGFMALDALARQWSAVWKPDKGRKCELASGPGVLLVKPQTYMNDSGSCVGPLMRYFKFTPEQVLVVYDDTALPVGGLRLRAGGSDGGHNGMKSLIAHLGSDHFPRLRIGIGSHGQKSLVGHVLGHFAPEEKPLIEEGVQHAAKAVQLLLREGFEAAANRYNLRKKKEPKPAPPAPEQPPAPAADSSEE